MAVILTEGFEDSVAAVFARFDDGSQGQSNMTLVTDSPPFSSGTKSLKMTNPSATQTALFYNLAHFNAAGYTELYVRVYIKYTAGGSWHHNGLWIGGQNPATDFVPSTANPVTPPTGADVFYTGAEVGHPVQSQLGFDLYTGWMEMRQLSNGDYWGNTFRGASTLTLTAGTWYAVEVRIAMNTPTTGRSGQLQMWVDDVEAVNLAEGSPLGSWTENVWSTGVGTSPFEGFRWRSTTNLPINWLWLLNYTDAAGTIQFDDLVVSTARIGGLPALNVPADPGAYSLTGAPVGLTPQQIQAWLRLRH